MTYSLYPFEKFSCATVPLREFFFSCRVSPDMNELYCKIYYCGSYYDGLKVFIIAFLNVLGESIL